MFLRNSVDSISIMTVGRLSPAFSLRTGKSQLLGYPDRLIVPPVFNDTGEFEERLGIFLWGVKVLRATYVVKERSLSKRNVFH